MPPPVTEIFVLLLTLATADGRIISGAAGPFNERQACERQAAASRTELGQQEGVVAANATCLPLQVPKAAPSSNPRSAPQPQGLTL